jgi:hypothetical protein
MKIFNKNRQYRRILYIIKSVKEDEIMFRKKMLRFGIMAAISAMLFCGCRDKGGDSVNEVKNDDSDNVILSTSWVINSRNACQRQENWDFRAGNSRFSCILWLYMVE